MLKRLRILNVSIAPLLCNAVERVRPPLAPSIYRDLTGDGCGRCPDDFSGLWRNAGLFHPAIKIERIFAQRLPVSAVEGIGITNERGVILPAEQVVHDHLGLVRKDRRLLRRLVSGAIEPEIPGIAGQFHGENRQIRRAGKQLVRGLIGE